MKNEHTLRNLRRIVIGTALALLIPLGAMAVTNVWSWDTTDFVFAGGLILVPAFTYELVVKKVVSPSYQPLVGVMLLTVAVLIWIEGAVGIFE